MFLNNLVVRSVIVNRHLLRRLPPLRTALAHSSSRGSAPKTVDEDDVPLRYMKSSAARWTAKVSRTGVTNERLSYEPIVIITSLTIFMLYFCVLREENHVDEELGRTLYSRIAGLEEHQLKVSLEFNQSKGIPTGEIEQRLTEINAEKLNATDNTE